MDGMPSEFYKCSNGLLLRPSTTLFNYVFDTEFYPIMWCEGLINLLHQQGGISNAENYCKITVTSALGNFFDNVLNQRLQYGKKCIIIEDPC